MLRFKRGAACLAVWQRVSIAQRGNKQRDNLGRDMQIPRNNEPQEPLCTAVRNRSRACSGQHSAISELERQVEGAECAPQVIHNLYCALEHMLTLHSQGDAPDRQDLVCCYGRMQLMLACRMFPALKDVGEKRRGA